MKINMIGTMSTSFITNLWGKKLILMSETIFILGFDLTEDLSLNTRTYFGCQSDWPEMKWYVMLKRSEYSLFIEKKKQLF